MKQIFYIGFFLFQTVASAQVNIHYFSPSVPQANYLNPAHMGNCKWTVGIPLLNGIAVQAAHSGFTFNQLFATKEGNTVFLVDNALDHIGRSNLLSENLEISDIFIGYRYKNHSFNFAVRERQLFNLNYNRTFLRLALEGNTPFVGQRASLHNSWIKLNYMRQYSLGYARQQNPGFSYGIHLNLLFGKANIALNPKGLALETDEETFALELEMDSRFNTSLPFNLINAQGAFDFDAAGTSPSSVLLNRKNKGLSVDAGVIYNFNPDITLFASVVDFGFIRYRTNVVGYDGSGSFTYEGPEENTTLDESYFSNALRELNNSVNFSRTSAPYFYVLPTRVYGGISNITTPRLTSAFLLQANFLSWIPRLYAGAQLKYQLGRNIRTLASWSWSHRSVLNFGTGLVFDFKPLNFYIVSDNIAGFFWPGDTKNINLQFGFNLKLGCQKKKTETGINGCSWIKPPKAYQLEK
jgi:hypothetical protein